jgi:hypothetical protein
VRVKIACRNPSKILAERLFELYKKLYLVDIKVEGFEQRSEDGEGSDKDDDSKGDDDHGNFDDCDDLTDEPENMETDKKNENQSALKALVSSYSVCVGGGGGEKFPPR